MRARFAPAYLLLVICGCGERFVAADSDAAAIGTTGGSSSGSGGAGGASGGSAGTGARPGTGGSGGSGAFGGSGGKGGSGGSAGVGGTGALGGGGGSGGSTSSGGTGGTTSGSGGKGGTGGTGGGTSGCEAMSTVQCVDCCKQKFPEAVMTFVNSLYGCACSQCYTDCSTTLCDAVFSPNSTCVACIRLYANATSGCTNVPGACTVDPACAALWACLDTCF
jgi:hypothetical protein